MISVTLVQSIRRMSIQRAARRGLTYLYATQPVSQNRHESLLKNTKVVASLVKDSYQVSTTSHLKTKFVNISTR